MDVILVDEQDNPVGTMEKMEVHEKALLHRAFSVFIFNNRDELLIQKRADTKYHSAGLWTNTCCSHPQPGQLTIEAAQTRLQEEMGFKTELMEVFSFIYKAPMPNGLTEHEFDHVFIGIYNGAVWPDPREVSDHRFIPLPRLHKNIELYPEQYTEWFKIAMPKLQQYIDENT